MNLYKLVKKDKLCDMIISHCIFTYTLILMEIKITDKHRKNVLSPS